MAVIFQPASNKYLRRLSIAALLLGLALTQVVALEPNNPRPPSETEEQSLSRTVPQSKVPDISGEWRVVHLKPNGDMDDYQLSAVVQETKDSQEFLVLGEAGIERPNSLRVKWSEADQRFEGVVTIGGLTCKQFMQLLDDGKMMRVNVETLASGSPGKDLNDDPSFAIGKTSRQIWSRSEELYSSERPEQPSPAYYPPTPQADNRTDSVVEKNNGQLAKGIGRRNIPVSSFRPSRELVEVPGAYELLLALAQQEVMAEGLAEKIRTLAASKDNSESQQTDLHRELENSLIDALDVKFKLEQMQIKLLEEQIASLKNQIGKRQARSKQIAKRRARELIDGATARRVWEPEAR